MATEKDIAQIVDVMQAAFPNWHPTDNTVEVYFQILKEEDSKLLKAAVFQAIAEPGRAFAPSPGEIRGVLLDVQKMISNVPDSFQAWGEVQRQILENGGEFGTPVWSHPVIEEAVNRIGWRNLRMSDNPQSERIRFVQAYEQLVSRVEKEQMLLPPVRGYIETNGGKMLAPADQMKQLADRLGK